jgi:hypothetical protein
MHAKWLWLMLVLSCVSQAATPREDEILLQGNVQGKQTVTTLDGGATQASTRITIVAARICNSSSTGIATQPAC